MARHSDEKNKIIELLSERPSVYHACKKVGIGRTSVYRWMKDNLKFRRAVEHALEEGRSNWGEIAESVILKKISEGDFQAAKYFLTHNMKRYAPKHPIYAVPGESNDNESYKRKYEELLWRTKPPPEETLDAMAKAFENHGFDIGKAYQEAEEKRKAKLLKPSEEK